MTIRLITASQKSNLKDTFLYKSLIHNFVDPTQVIFFGDNKEYIGMNLRGTSRLSLDTAYAMSGTLRYKATQAMHLYGTAQINRGGATQLNGAAFTGAPNNTRLALGALFIATDKSQIQLRYAQDVDIQNGLRNAGETMLRWSTVF